MGKNYVTIEEFNKFVERSEALAITNTAMLVALIKVVCRDNPKLLEPLSTVFQFQKSSLADLKDRVYTGNPEDVLSFFQSVLANSV